MSGQMRVAIAAGYAVLLAVNGIFGSGAFGVPTNAEVSDAYPTNVTPAGLTFAIWGPIFLLQGLWDRAHGRRESSDARIQGGPAMARHVGVRVRLAARLRPRAARRRQGRRYHFRQSWRSSCRLLFVGGRLRFYGQSREFDQGRFRGRITARRLTDGHQRGVACGRDGASDLHSSRRIRRQHSRRRRRERCSSAASWRGVLRGAHVPRAVAALGLGYGAATCWACFGMTKGDSPQVVKDVATYGGYLVAVVSAAALILRPRAAPPADGALAEKGVALADP